MAGRIAEHSLCAWPFLIDWLSLDTPAIYPPRGTEAGLQFDADVPGAFLSRSSVVRILIHLFRICGVIASTPSGHPFYRTHDNLASHVTLSVRKTSHAMMLEDPASCERPVTGPDRNARGPSIEDASNVALKNCGSDSCKIAYSDCTDAVQIQ